jgi:hypothetical protein
VIGPALLGVIASMRRSASVTLSLFQFDAWPPVDEVPGTTTFADFISAANIVGTPTVGGSAGALKATSPPNGAYVTSVTNDFDPGLVVLTTNAVTIETFAYRDGSTSVGANEEWEISIAIELVTEDSSENVSFLLGIGNSASAPYSGTAKMEVDFGGSTVFSGTLQHRANYDIPDAAYTHIAAVLEGSNVRAYAAGVKLIDVNLTLAGTPLPGDLRFTYSVARFESGSADTSLKFQDSARFTDGALYSANFTPPTGPLG